MRTLLLVGVSVSLCASLEAQSLGEAARRAEEARKASTAPAVAFDMRDVDPVLARQELLGVQIDDAAWTRFLQADRAIGRTLTANADALQRLRGLEVSSIRALERFLHGQGAVLMALSGAGIEPREYASTHLAMALAIQEGRGTPAAVDALPPAVKANVGFIRSHERDVRSLATPTVRLALRIVAPPPKTLPAVPVASAPASSAPVSLASAHGSPSPPAADPGGPIDTRPGAEIPDFTFVDFNGNSRRLSDFRGKYLLLDFWGSWCPPCRAEVPFAKDAYARFQSRGFEILGMDYERSATVDQVRAYLRDNGVGWTFARPDSVRSLIVERFQINSFPTIFMLDPDGRVMPIRESALRGKALAATLERVLSR